MAEFSAIQAVTLARMDSSIHSNKLALFPLCDVDGVLIDALCDTSDSPGTRADALLLAWRLSLPKGMDVRKAAEALIVVALSIPRKAWTDHQLLIMRELMALTGQKATALSVNKNGLLVGHRRRRARDNAVDDNTVDRVEPAEKPQKSGDSTEPKPTAKESKKWWKLVGPDLHERNAD